MRASSRTRLALSLTLAIAAGVSTPAHRLDEYLQAARLDLLRDRIRIDLALTPGTELADSIRVALDRDGDGTMSPAEQHAYARDVARQLRLSLDEATLPLRVTSSTFPALDALDRGESTIRLRLDADHAPLSSGPHRVSFSNGYFVRHGVYLANALVPNDTGIVVKAQQRTPDQRELTIEYAVGPSLAGLDASGGLLVIVLIVLFVRYTRRHGIPS